jgi:hypothetical protein
MSTVSTNHCSYLSFASGLNVEHGECDRTKVVSVSVRERETHLEENFACLVELALAVSTFEHPFRFPIKNQA